MASVMIKRLFVGLLLGALMGLGLAVLAVKGLGMQTFEGTAGITFAYLFAAAGGILIGFVAGKPIWSKERIEAGLKAVIGALVAAAGMAALRQWGTPVIDASALAMGKGAMGLLPVVSLPILTIVLGVFFEIDNDDKSAPDEDEGTPAVRVATPKVEEDDALGESVDEDEAEKGARRNR